jgi:hypothetical protein
VVLLAFNQRESGEEGGGSSQRGIAAVKGKGKGKGKGKEKEKAAEKAAHFGSKKSGTWSSFMSGTFPPRREDVGEGSGSGQSGGGGAGGLDTPPGSDIEYGSDYGTPPASCSDDSSDDDNESNSLTDLVAQTRKKSSAAMSAAEHQRVHTSGGMKGGTPARKGSQPRNETQINEVKELSGPLAGVTSMNTTYTSFGHTRGRSVSGSGELFEADDKSAGAVSL